MEVTGAAQIGMVDDCVLGIARTAFELVGDDEGDALVGQCADRDGAGRDQLGAFGINRGPPRVRVAPDDNFECYSQVPEDLEALSYGGFTDKGIELFKRVYVNGVEPLAGWLLDNSDVMASSYYFPNEKRDNEKAYPSQILGPPPEGRRSGFTLAERVCQTAISRRSNGIG
jgi:hypothetical protein